MSLSPLFPVLKLPGTTGSDAAPMSAPIEHRDGRFSAPVEGPKLVASCGFWKSSRRPSSGDAGITSRGLVMPR